MWLTTTIFLVVAFCGLVFINADPVDANLANGSTASSLSDITDNKASSDNSFSFGTPVGSIVKMLSALIIVVMAVYAGVFLLKKFMHSKQQRVNGKILLEVIETTYVGPKKTVSLLRVADKSVLVGVTDQHISVLSELDADETAVILASDNSEENSADANFGNLLDKTFTNIRKMTSGRKTENVDKPVTQV